MLDSITKVKNFIQWCQDNKVKAFRSKNIEFELSEMAFLPEVEDLKEIDLSDTKTFSDYENMSAEEKEELEMWSAGGAIRKL